MTTTNGSYAELKPTDDNFSIKIEFDRTKESIMKFDSVNNYYYIEMGTNPFNNNEPLRWITFAEKQLDGTFSFFNKTSKPTNGSTYYFISELILRTEVSDSADAGGVAFQNSFYVLNGNYYATDENGVSTGYSPDDYAVSNIRRYLNGYTVYDEAVTDSDIADSPTFNPSTDAIPTTESGNQVSIASYNILTSEVYSQITARPLVDLYETAEHTTKIYDCGSEADKLWLISYTNNEYSLATSVYGYGGKTTDGGNDSANWFMRSPCPYSGEGSINVWAVWPSGTYMAEVPSGIDCSFGVRPAFQITI